jgi:hypothetical protein
MSTARSVYQLAYEISPILLVNGVASGIAGGILPIVAITEASNFSIDLLSGNLDLSLADYFAHFEPMPGSMLANNAIGQYPFANQTVAANAIIAQPLQLSLLIKCPVKGQAGYVSRLMTMTALKVVLDAHNQNGGTYAIATPAYLYTNCILTGLTDVTASGDSMHVQTAYKWDFQQPLIALDTAAQTYNQMLSKVAAGLPVSL